MCVSHIQDSFCRIFLFDTIKQKNGRSWDEFSLNGNLEMNLSLFCRDREDKV